MNERIQELMSQTLDEKFAGTWSTMDMQDLTKFAEKFAELLIQRCGELSDLAEDNDLHGSTIIKRHFGVEE